MSIPLDLRVEPYLPDNRYAGILVGRAWRPELAGPWWQFERAAAMT